MPSYVIDEKEKCYYLKESVSYWDKDKKGSRNKQKCIGKIDKQTCKVLLYPEFKDSCKSEYIIVKKERIFINKDDNYLSFIKDKYVQNKLDNLIDDNCEESFDKINFDKDLAIPLAGDISPLDFHDLKSFGGSYFIAQIAHKVKLIDILIVVFPKKMEIYFEFSFIYSYNE